MAALLREPLLDLMMEVYLSSKEGEGATVLEGARGGAALEDGGGVPPLEEGGVPTCLK